MSARFRRSARGLLLALTLTGFAWGEACPDRGLNFFETEGYQTRRVELSGFWLLRLAPLAMRELEGQPIRLAAVKNAQGALRQALIEAPALFDSPVDCDSARGGLRVKDPDGSVSGLYREGSAWADRE